MGNLRFQINCNTILFYLKKYVSINKKKNVIIKMGISNEEVINNYFNNTKKIINK